MKKSNSVKKLAVSRETLFSLNGSDLGKAAAGSSGWSCDSVCPTVDTHRCN